MHRKMLRAFLGVALLVGSLAIASPVAAAAPTPTVQFRLPFVGGQFWKVNQGWHRDYSRSYYAYDFGPPTTAGLNLPIVAAADGTVHMTSDGDPTCDDGPNGWLGCTYDDNSYVLIKHADNTYSEYVHLSKVLVAKGQVVKQGEIIGRVGKVGYASGPHLHFDRIWSSTPSNLDSFKSMKTSFYDVPGTGTLSSPVELTDEAWYKAVNPCSLDVSKPIGDRFAVPSGAFCARYYRDRGLENFGTEAEDRYASVMSRTETSIYHDWASGFPESSYGGKSYTAYDGYWTSSEFGAKFAGRFNFYADIWTFFYVASDGIRITIDGVTRVDSWITRSTNYSGQFDLAMTSGYHTIEVSYFNSGASPKVSFTWADCDTGIC